MGLREASKKQRTPTGILPRLRVISGENIALGPGKIDLLQAVQQSGSIRKAAMQLGMSYMRAWTLIRTMNKSFNEPLVIALRGAVERGGGAHLTKTGRTVLAVYQRMNAKCLRVVAPEWRQLRTLLRA